MESGYAGLIGSWYQAQTDKNIAMFNTAKDVATTAFQWKHDKEMLKREQDFNAQQALLSREFSSSEAQKQRDYEERLANTAYQRAIADMKAAGINPASIAGASPAATPAGAMANSAAAGSHGYSSQAYNTPMKNIDFGNYFSSAINGMIAKDRDAAKYLAQEFRDNAKHAHKMEEIHEAIQEKKDARAYLDLVKHRHDMERDSINNRHRTDVESYKYLHDHASYRNYKK